MDQDSYDQGYIDGLKAYAHWEDGKQKVGTTGTTLEEAIENRKYNFNYINLESHIKNRREQNE